ncbi:alkaline phosphatase family protein [Neobacillus sp. YIM B06451]|uniref:alkaline phosphatase family protein n=1 Tax=Neobacillus sp. YIM B06451 TaxID=3070994 RepID=UPI002931E15F|nr:alkaline phosphatase family protein [Neobacillus sp. YIM B06451]
MSVKPTAGKPVIMIIVDTLMDAPLNEAIRAGMAPAIDFLIKNGTYSPGLVAPFPTMSVNVDTTLLTGTYCDQHKIPGLVWFNKKENRLINYGSHYRELFKLGVVKAVEDLLFNLNQSHISREVRTLHEDLYRQRFNSASINALVFRGNTPHFLDLPKMLGRFTPLSRRRPVYAPAIFSYGRFSKLNESWRNQHFWQKAGVNDSSSVQQFSHLVKENKLPPFTIVYLPDLDQRIHKYGRLDRVGIEKADKQLQKILGLFGDWEKALELNQWIIMGDNGQAWVHSNRNHAVIDLRKLLSPYKIMRLRKGPRTGDQIALAVNDRMAYIYTLNEEKELIEDIAMLLTGDNRVDVIAWKNGRQIKVRSGGIGGEIRFQPGGVLQDQYGQLWELEGNMEILDLSVKDNRVQYGLYPDALARLYSCLHSHEGEFLAVSARPGHEFAGEGSPVHLGGAGHGGLHEQDSLVPLIVSGTESLPEHMRIVDLKRWVLSLITKSVYDSESTKDS